MKIHHTPYHWIAVSLILVAFLLTLSEAYGQSPGAAAVFEGRPALAGAQGGQGAQAGLAQGGIGVQGNESAQRGLRLRKPAGLEDTPQGTIDSSITERPSDGSPRQARKEGAPTQGTGDDSLNAPVIVAANDSASRNEVVPGRDRSLAKDQRSALTKSKRAAKRTISRARHGVSQIDSSASAPAR